MKIQISIMAAALMLSGCAQQFEFEPKYASLINRAVDGDNEAAEEISETLDPVQDPLPVPLAPPENNANGEESRPDETEVVVVNPPTTEDDEDETDEPSRPDEPEIVVVNPPTLTDDEDEPSRRDEPETNEPESSEPESNERVVFCHVPSGNPENAHTISIPESAMEAHLTRHHHGDSLDYMGDCLTDENEALADANPNGKRKNNG